MGDGGEYVIKLLALLALAAPLLGACAQVKTEVATFHSFQDGAPRDRSFLIMPSKAQASSLEFKAYADLVAQQLEAKGLVRVHAALEADYAVFLYYDIDGGRTVVSSVPIYGQTGGGTTSTVRGYAGGRPVSGTVYTPPTYGVTGYAPVSDTVYGRRVRIVMLDARHSLLEDRPIIVYEATGKSTGQSGTLAAVMPEIIESMFVDWPGKSGATVTRYVTAKE